MPNFLGIRHHGLIVLVIEAMKQGEVAIPLSAAQEFVKNVLGKPGKVSYEIAHSFDATALKAEAIGIDASFKEAVPADFRRLDNALKALTPGTLQCQNTGCYTFGLKNVGLQWQTLPADAECPVCGNPLHLSSREVTHAVAWGLPRVNGKPVLLPVEDKTFSLRHIGDPQEMDFVPTAMLERILREMRKPVLGEIMKICKDRRIQTGDLLEELGNGVTGAILGPDPHAWLKVVVGDNPRFTLAQVTAAANRAEQTVRAREVEETRVVTKVATSTTPTTTTSSPTTEKGKIPHFHFVVASEDVKTYLDPLEAAMATFEKKGTVKITHNGRVRAGDKWQEITLSNIKAADKVVFMVSVDALANDNCMWQLGLCKPEQIQVLLLRPSLVKYVPELNTVKPLVNGQVLAELSSSRREKAIMEAVEEML